MQGISGDVIIISAGTFLLFCIFGFVFFFVIAYNNRHRKYQLEKEEIIKKFEMEKLQAQLEIQEQTLKTISGEIHDNIGQILSLVGLQLSTLPTSNEEKLEHTSSLLNKAIADLRDLSKSLDTDRITSIGIIEALDYELQLLEKTGKYTTNFEIDGDFIELPPDKTIIIYRIIQEVLNNIIKHAKATVITVNISSNELESFITIKDNGVGFMQDDNTIINGLGLKNIAKRASLVGGIAKIESKLQQGTVITFSLPKK
jgi:signal transduction histidine kinase